MPKVLVTVDLSTAWVDDDQTKEVFLVQACEENVVASVTLAWDEFNELFRDVRAALDAYEARREA